MSRPISVLAGLKMFSQAFVLSLLVAEFYRISFIVVLFTFPQSYNQFNMATLG